MVTRQGKEQVVVLPIEQFVQLTKRVRQPKSFVKFFAESPLDLSRDVDSGRQIMPWLFMEMLRAEILVPNGSVKSCAPIAGKQAYRRLYRRKAAPASVSAWPP